MMNRIANVFIWIAGAAFAVAAMFTVVAWFIGIALFITGKLNV